MDDFNFWWYIIAAVIYFLTRGKKKKQPTNSRPGTENRPQTSQPKSFEDLLKEITEGREPEPEPAKSIPQQKPVVIRDEEEERRKAREAEGRKRMFADDESKRVYEESIKMAEGADLEFNPSEHYREPRLFKGEEEVDKEPTIADEIRDGLNTSEAKKAIIYAEILNRKY